MRAVVRAVDKQIFARYTKANGSYTETKNTVLLNVLPEGLQEEVLYAVLFSSLIKGATIVYNILLCRLAYNNVA